MPREEAVALDYLRHARANPKGEYVFKLIKKIDKALKDIGVR